MVTTTKRTSKPKLSEVRIEPADNGYTVHSRNHGDYMEPAGPPKPKVFEKKNGHEVLKHVARKLGIKAKISPMDEKESAAEDMAEGNQEE
jgi:hypothetical protein